MVKTFKVLFTLAYLINMHAQYIRPKVTVHKGAETIQGRKQFKGRNYKRIQLKQTYFYVIENDLLLHKILSQDQKLENALMCNNSEAIDRVQRSTIHRANHTPPQATVCNFFLVFEILKRSLLRRRGF